MIYFMLGCILGLQIGVFLQLKRLNEYLNTIQDSLIVILKTCQTLLTIQNERFPK
jgi:hypothetical protein